ncbi:MAG: hypothetical protein KBD65_00870 [Candidatus Moranbacteria bacterium]|nr:hypothetical protein [Candidatus Moranbacteria bacterium]
MADLHFKRDDYILTDLRELERILFFIPPIVIENTNPLYLKQNRVAKDTYHAKLIELHDNKIFIKKLRRELKMPFDNKGFKILKKFLPYERSFTNVNFEYLSSDFKVWFFSWTKKEDYYDEYEWWEKTTPVVYEAVNQATEKALKKWKLPRRYFDAIEELIIFNTIIPANTGITFLQEFKHLSHERARVSIGFDTDTTKDELIRAIKEYPHSTFKRLVKDLPGKIRKNPRKSSETKKMLAIYNKYKKDGKQDKKIFTIIRDNPEFGHLSMSAIRDRIKRN